MTLAYGSVEQSTAAYFGALLGGFSDALRKQGIASRMVWVIRLRLRHEEYAFPVYVPPMLEVRGADRRVRATVTIVRGVSEPAYSVRPADGERYYLFPVSEGASALAFVVGRAPDWQLIQ
ncbi:hypothetical protein Ssi03_74790 [Sphaerisporangium siamense]|uniref:Uncharacterized protein n=1 Tax=Sphaerisporangium siamense TaxID=795645 RepID=A0A7W7D8S2_9ACTN|nr:hypothetical protein [Sphaerisporangium siamense]MBB4702332.1 hypothetical protein [Sphaerisporangium siamense]GII89489.1 hypothetical protein Ssi03_74790 [Sphaerisporangium siamense]